MSSACSCRNFPDLQLEYFHFSESESVFKTSESVSWAVWYDRREMTRHLSVQSMSENVLIMDADGSIKIAAHPVRFSASKSTFSPKAPSCSQFPPSHAKTAPSSSCSSQSSIQHQITDTSAALALAAQQASASAEQIELLSSTSKISTNSSSGPNGKVTGAQFDLSDIIPSGKASLADAEADEHKIGEAPATAICSNVITSGVFFTVGLAAGSAGVWSPLCFLLVSLTLHLFRDIYGEAVTALPLNGGAYNLLLLTTSKSLAAVGAILTMMAYACSGVISSASGVDYLASVFPELPKGWCTFGVLVVFALLTLWGFKESALTSLVIFSIHIALLTILFFTSIIYVCKHGVQPAKYLYASAEQPPFFQSIFYGFSIASLAVTGFETSANFVEELKPGVFEKTLRNMWWFCLWINPGFSLLGVLAVDADIMRREPNATLAVLGRETGGKWLQVLISVDAFVVLAGAVLTDYLGFVGVAERLAMDQCFPRVFLAKNKWRKTKHWIIVGFLALCTSMYLLLEGRIAVLANVYAVSFFGVMGLYAVGDMLLKYRCGELPRNTRASWSTLIGALLLVLVAFSGVVFSNTDALVAFSYYFVGAGSVVALMFWRVPILTMCYHGLRHIYRELGWDLGPSSHSLVPTSAEPNSSPFAHHTWSENGQLVPTAPSSLSSSSHHHDHNLTHRLMGRIHQIQHQPMAFFAKRPIVANLNKVITYIKRNEDCTRIRFIYCDDLPYESASDLPTHSAVNVDSDLGDISSADHLQKGYPHHYHQDHDFEATVSAFHRHLAFLSEVYPRLQLDLVTVRGAFCPEVVLRLSNELNIPRYMMCIKCPKSGFKYDIEKLGGVRVITI